MVLAVMVSAVLLLLLFISVPLELYVSLSILERYVKQCIVVCATISYTYTQIDSPLYVFASDH